MKNLFKAFQKNTSGATAIEYGLIAALIALVLITSLTLVGTRLSGTFNTIGTKLAPTATR
jgi:pilus assembly protein Flp/PilA